METPIKVFTTAHTIFISNYYKTPVFTLLDLLATNIDKRSRSAKTSLVQSMEIKLQCRRQLHGRRIALNTLQLSFSKQEMYL